jgi:zinc transport system ATP-binding protein
LPTPSPLLSLRDASAGHGARTVVAGVTLDVLPGEVVGIVGPNGCGKTTLLRVLLGLAAPTSGEIRRDPGLRIGYVPQRESTEPLFRLSAEEFVASAAVPGAWLPWSAREERSRRARAALEAVGLGGMTGRVWQDLSGGQRQRVLLARALAADPQVLVLDEPTSGMDVRAEEEFLAVLRDLRRTRGLAVVLVTHALHVVAEESDRVALFVPDASGPTAAPSRVVVGPTAEVITSERLSAVWGVPVVVDEADRVDEAGGVDQAVRADQAGRVDQAGGRQDRVRRIVRVRGKTP